MIRQYHGKNNASRIHPLARVDETIGSLGVVIRDDLQNQGFATEACDAMLRFLLQERKVSRVLMGCYASNPASQRMIQKLGLMPLPLHLRASAVLARKLA